MPYATPPGGNPPVAAPPAPSVPATIGSLMSSPNQSNQAAGVIAAGQAPSIAQSGLTMEGLLAQIGLAVPAANEAQAASTLGLEYGLEQSGLTHEQQGIQGEALGAQSGLLGLQKQIEEAQFGLSERQRRDQAAITGTLNTGAYGMAEQGAGLAQQGQEAQFAFSAGDIARAQQNLELAAKANGISVQQMLAQWQQGLEQTGVQADPMQLYTQLLAQQGNQVQTVGAAGAETGLLSPGSLATGAMQGGLNPLSLFEGMAF